MLDQSNVKNEWNVFLPIEAQVGIVANDHVAGRIETCL